jgi:hypothetical protein
LRWVILAAKSRSRARILESADADLALLMALLRIGMQLEYLPFRRYEDLARRADEIGKMIGSWMKKI